MSEPHKISDELLETAADWHLRVRAAGTDSEVHVAWLSWIEADPAHGAAFMEIQRTWDIVGRLESPPWPRAEELASEHSLKAIVPEAEEVATARFEKAARGGRSGARHRSKSSPLRWVLAASIVAGMAALLAGRVELEPGSSDGRSVHKRITTGRGEQQAAVLPDGSRLEFGGLTGVQVAFTPERRLIVADEGEIFYKVERDSKRPFIVQAGPVQVRAIGTAFSVRREGETVAVVVTEGLVEVKADAAPSAAGGALQAVRAKAGERVKFDGGQLAVPMQAIQTESSGPWRRGHLRFEDESLRVVVASLNRYSSRPMVIADATLQDLRFTGTVFDDSVEDWLQGVQAVLPITVDVDDPGRIVLARRK